jgi:hypothetical protein
MSQEIIRTYFGIIPTILKPKRANAFQGQFFDGFCCSITRDRSLFRFPKAVNVTTIGAQQKFSFGERGANIFGKKYLHSWVLESRRLFDEGHRVKRRNIHQQ